MKQILFLTLTAAIITSGQASAKTAGSLVADEAGIILHAENGDRPFVPASIIKLLTSLAALETLGPDHRFPTWAAYDDNTRDLYIKGFGDPLFISEAIEKLVLDIVKEIKPVAIRHIILDHGYFHSDIVIPGTGRSLNPYDATTGALCANFNTVFFRFDKNRNRYVSAEPQTPLLDFFQADIRATGQKKGRILLPPEKRRLYPGHLIKFFLNEQQIPVEGIVQLGPFPTHPSKKIVFKSEFTLDRVVERLLRYSNNFMANQLMLYMGAELSGPPAILAKGVAELNRFAEDRLNLKNFTLTEGSGLSRQNRFTPKQMLKILLAFKPYHHLLRQEGTEYYKTGTLSDVRTRAGYIRGKDGKLYPFVIMVNKKGRGYDAVRKKLHGIVSGRAAGS